jgi:glycolate oxidase FAD binding subunit
MAVGVDLVGLAAGLESAGVPWRELADEEWPAHAVDDLRPTAICWPESYEEAARALAVADRLRLAVTPRGSGTKLTLGNVPRRCDVILSTDRLARLIDYAPANLTVIAQAGMSLGELQRTLAPARQHLPLDPPWAERATLGGILATNSSGPRRLGRGTARDLVIGTAAATTSGAVVRAGGRVVKNVAGYDLNKLYIGSLGTLALVVEVGFKIAPIPERQVTTIGAFGRVDNLAEASRVLRRSPLQPVALDLFDQTALNDLDRSGLPSVGAGYALAVLGAAPGGAVERQRNEFARVLREAGATSIADLPSAECDEFWAAVGERWRGSGPLTGMQLRLSVPPARLRDAIEWIESAREQFGAPISIVGRAGTGVVYVSSTIDADGGRDQTVLGAIEDLRRNCERLQGSLVVERCPTRFKKRLEIWGIVGSSLELMRKLKAALDPGDTLNPGRFVGGI